MWRLTNIITCNVITLLHIFLNVTESRKQVPSTAHTSQWVLTDKCSPQPPKRTCAHGQPLALASD